MSGPIQDKAGDLELVGLEKAFNGLRVLNGISMTARHGEFVSLVGPSGCGKTTTLNIVAGFEQPDGGDVRLGGRSLVPVPTHRRQLGMVFQSHALFPHMTIAENVGFGLAMRRQPKAEIVRRVGEALEMVHLTGYEGRYPRELSGGQQQRVGIARALTVEPRVILMDEPLSSLDAKLRREMQVEIRRIQQAVGITVIYVTHDQEEALTLSDRIVLMNKGVIEQAGTPEEIYSRPATPFAAGFIGEASFLDGVIQEIRGPRGVVRLDGGALVEIVLPRAIPSGDRIRLAVRPHRVRLAEPRENDAGLAGTVISRAFVGPILRYLVELPGGGELLAQSAAVSSPVAGVGDRISASVEPSDWLVLEPERCLA